MNYELVIASVVVVIDDDRWVVISDSIVSFGVSLTRNKKKKN